MRVYFNSKIDMYPHLQKCAERNLLQKIYKKKQQQQQQGSS